MTTKIEYDKSLTFNDILTELHESDFVIGFKNGEAEVIKNRWGSIQKVKPQIAIQYLIRVLKPFTGINFFDNATEQELIVSILSVLDKHRVEPVIIGEQKL